jgi:hypothetical protein
MVCLAAYFLIRNANMTILQGNKRFVEAHFKLEEDLEELVSSKSERFFGAHTVFIKRKRKLKGLVLGNTIPDGFLFDLTDRDNPEFYLIEFELLRHDFKHISQQLDKFFGFFHDWMSQINLVKDLFLHIKADAALKGVFKKYLLGPFFRPAAGADSSQPFPAAGGFGGRDSFILASTHCAEQRGRVYWSAAVWAGHSFHVRSVSLATVPSKGQQAPIFHFHE